MTKHRLLSLICLTFALGCTGYVEDGQDFEEYPYEEGYEDLEGEPEGYHDHDHEFDDVEDELGLNVTGAVSFSCDERSDTGYTRGVATPIIVVTVDGKPVEKNTANAFLLMAEAASRDGVRIRVISGFRTMAQQRRLYGCYINNNCNNGNLAARPGYSKHQSGTALDLNTSNRAVYNWLTSHGGRFGFRRTVPQEPWHWVYEGGDIDGPCTSGPPPPTPRGCGILNEGESIGRGDELTSCNGRYSLVHQGDGNVVLYDVGNGHAVLFATWTQSLDTSALWMQADGNVVLYSADGGTPHWASGTNAEGESFLNMQDDGNLVIYNEYHRPLWTRH